ncbi:uncharacterized protein LOC34621211 [Cyclospora cayetanensis]|uniref:Uncharacterized protein LOC34621211 n=1 Tax=Cyclospora cayetanensis TaxID=88456 RepID=A0A6P6RWT2_9EIME|nr:uncharacterized protein LOC34621211 [Cyclospora cayetanensis]
MRRVAAACVNSESLVACGKIEKALEIRQELANFLASHKAPTSAALIRQTSLTLARHTAASPIVSALLRDIGEVGDQNGLWETQNCDGCRDSESAAGRWEAAELFFSESLQAARRCNDENESKESAKRLAEIKHNQAKTLAKLSQSVSVFFYSREQQEGHLSDALAKQRAFLEFAMLSGDESMQWKARHALGLTLMKHAYCVGREANSRERECMARAALASAYRSLNRNQEAVKELEIVLDVATQAASTSLLQIAKIAACLPTYTYTWSLHRYCVIFPFKYQRLSASA